MILGTIDNIGVPGGLDGPADDLFLFAQNPILDQSI